jgi:succinate dehydrogenase / fumarate reductase flavoprotein subunit
VQLDDKGRQYNTDVLEAFELGCLLDLAEATAASALNRTESRGAHFRDDYAQRDDAHWLKHTLVVQQGAPGAAVTAGPLAMSYKPVVITKFEPKERKY